MLESVPNFSEGRDEAVIGALRESLSAPARLLDVHTDPDHHRSVFTLVGEPDELVETLLAGVACARERIDLRRHDGAHPRIGAADVVPIVPIRSDDLEHARETALTLARRIGTELGLPVFLYGELAPGRGPAFFRRGGPAGAPAADRRRRALTRLRAGTARRAGGRCDRRGAPAADRVQRQPARLARSCPSGCVRCAGDRRRVSRGARTWARAAARGRRPGVDERGGLGGGGAPRDRRADRIGGCVVMAQRSSARSSSA